jgi:hypothetical protein
MELGIVRIERQCGLEIRDGIVEGRELHVSHAQVLVDDRGPGVRCQGVLKVVDTFFGLAGKSKRKAQVGRDADVVRQTFESFPKPGYRLLLAVQPLEGHGQFVLNIGQLGIELDRLFQMRRCGFVLTHSLQCSSVFKLGQGIGRLQGDRCPKR